MKRWSVLAVVLVPAVGCLDLGGMSSDLPQGGDVVAPSFVRDVRWEPGEKVALRVELTATDPQGNDRRLGFRASPKLNPVARLTFYDAAGATVATLERELSHRC